MKDSQRAGNVLEPAVKYIKANNERFSTRIAPGGGGGGGGLGKTRQKMKNTKPPAGGGELVSISRRIMKDSQPSAGGVSPVTKYIKANNERFSTTIQQPAL